MHYLLEVTQQKGFVSSQFGQTNLKKDSCLYKYNLNNLLQYLKKKQQQANKAKFFFFNFSLIT